MLSDFLTLEAYFGYPESALFFEDITKHFTRSDIESAVQKGDLLCKTIDFGPDTGRTLYSLSQQGRQKLTPQ